MFHTLYSSTDSPKSLKHLSPCGGVCLALSPPWLVSSLWCLPLLILLGNYCLQNRCIRSRWAVTQEPWEFGAGEHTSHYEAGKTPFPNTPCSDFEMIPEFQTLPLFSFFFLLQQSTSKMLLLELFTVSLLFCWAADLFCSAPLIHRPWHRQLIWWGRV